MTKEQAIKIAKIFTKMDFSNPMGWTGYYDTELKELSQAIEIILNMLKQNSAEIQQKNTELAEKNAEIEKKNKQIKLMAQTILENTSELKTFWCNGCMQIANCPYKEAVNCIEDFFERKSRE